ncbi:hypothetical protein M086_2236 [Bacteroides fragilis str. S13 L11]|nr:hypothetical protein M074_2602 [Bacteroides fragilis str. DS-166]EXZ23982.1 hypothetical protein M086_2236 [Bacteroides fragilis str. S13 L11]
MKILLLFAWRFHLLNKNYRILFCSIGQYESFLNVILEV